MSNKKCISVVHNYAGIAHAINVWGAEFDANGRITHLYTTDNNDGDLESNKAPRTPAGLLKCAVEERGGNMYLANREGKCTIKLWGITLLGLHQDKWDAYFATPA